MVFNDFIRRRLASLLQPWLSDEPDLGLKLGFLRSTGTVKNLNFNTSVLNQLLDESTCYRFKEVAVDELSLGVSYWSFPAFILRVRGLRITLSVGYAPYSYATSGCIFMLFSRCCCRRASDM